eukprot:3854198-Rhodomonas_salina.2
MQPPTRVADMLVGETKHKRLLSALTQPHKCKVLTCPASLPPTRSLWAEEAPAEEYPQPACGCAEGFRCKRQASARYRRLETILKCSRQFGSVEGKANSAAHLGEVGEVGDAVLLLVVLLREFIAVVQQEIAPKHIDPACSSSPSFDVLSK